MSKIKVNEIEKASGSGITVPTGTTFTVTDGIAQASIANEAINEAKLQVSNAPTNGYFLSAQSGNTGGLTWATTGGGLQSQQVFTSSGTWTKPSGITKVKVIVTGGGGGGAGGDGNTNAGGAGGAGGTAIEIIDVSSVSSVTVTVGAHGTGGAAATNGTSGGTSSFGSYCSATGGGLGMHWQNAGQSGRGGSGSGGDINLDGGDGSQGMPHDASDDGHASDGGASYWGGGGQGSFVSGGYSRSNHADANAQPGKAYGSGGGGGAHTGSEQKPGANGKAGIVVVEEYA